MNKTADKSSKNNKKSSFVSFGNSIVSRIFLGYDAAEKSFFESYFYRFFSGVFRKFSKIRFLISEKCEESKIFKMSHVLVQKLLENNLRYYGVALFFFSVFYMAIFSVRKISLNGTFDYFSASNIYNLAFGVISLVFSLIMMSSRKCVASLLLESSLFSFLLFRVFCFDALKIQKISYVRRSHTFPVIVGMILALLAFFVSPIVLLSAILFIIFFTIVFRVPENGVIFLFLTLPFLNEEYSFAVTLLVCFSYFFKVIRSKRVFKAGLFDLSVIFFTVILFICGIISVNYPVSSKASLVVILFILFGVVISNTIRTSKLIEKCINVIVFSTAISSLFGIVDFIFSYFDISFTNTVFDDVLNLLNLITFDSWIEFAEFATLVLPLSFIKIKTSDKAFEKSSSFMSFLVILAFTALTFDVSIWFSVAFSLLVFVMFLRPRLSLGMICIFTISLFAYVVFPEPFELAKNYVFTYANTSESISIPAHFHDVLKNFEFLGVGSGASTPEYVFGCMFGFGDGDIYLPNTALSFILKYGFLGVISVIAMVVIYFLHATSFCYSENSYNNKMKLFTAACVSSVLTVSFKSLFFNVLITSESVLCVIMIVFISLAAKKSAIIEYVPEKTEHSVTDEGAI